MTVAPVASLRYCESDGRQVLPLKRPFKTRHFVQNNAEGPGVACVGVSAAAVTCARCQCEGGREQMASLAERGAGLYAAPDSTSGARYSGVPGMKCHSFMLEERA